MRATTTSDNDLFRVHSETLWNFVELYNGSDGTEQLWPSQCTRPDVRCNHWPCCCTCSTSQPGVGGEEYSCGSLDGCVLAFCQASLNEYRIVSYWCAVCSGVCGLQLHVHTHHPHRPPYRRIFYVTQFIWWLRCTKTRRIWLWTFIDVCSRVHVQLRGNIAQMWIQGFILAEGYEVGCRKGNLIPSKYVGLGLYTMFRKKVVRLIFGHNLCECWPIFKILSLTYSQETPMFFS